MKRYRIYTENINPQSIIDYVSARFDGFTLFTGIGFWQAESDVEPIPENSLVIEIITDKPGHEHRVWVLCGLIKRHNQQQSVLYTVEDVKSVLI